MMVALEVAMKRIWKSIWALVLAGLAVGCLVVLARAGSPQQQRPGPAAAGKLQDTVGVSGFYTAYLPATMYFYDPSYVHPFGIRMSGSVDNSSGLQVMKAAGSRWVTTNFIWSDVQPTSTTYNWSSFDTKVRNAQAAGMDVFVMFTGNPAWAAALPGGPVNNMGDLVNICTLMAERYDCDGTDDAPGSPCVHYWSFYGEPDNGKIEYANRGWGYWGYNGAEYARMLTLVSSAIHEANPKAQVSIGGIAFDYFIEDGGPFVRSFLTDTLKALQAYLGGPTAYIDAVAFHYYPISWPNIRAKGLAAREIMEHHGAGSLPLICPEAAYWSSPEFGSSEDRQAQGVVQMHVRAASVNVQFLTWYRVFDDPIENPEDASPDRTCGLLRVDKTPKPAYTAYQTMVRELDLARYARPFQYPGVEGYVFRPAQGGEKTVLWATSSDLNVPFAYPCVRLVNKNGSVLTILDGNLTNDMDGRVDGQVSVRTRANDPMYVERCP
jgi:hypothetical protein